MIPTRDHHTTEDPTQRPLARRARSRTPEDSSEAARGRAGCRRRGPPLLRRSERGASCDGARASQLDGRGRARCRGGAFRARVASGRCAGSSRRGRHRSGGAARMHRDMPNSRRGSPRGSRTSPPQPHPGGGLTSSSDGPLLETLASELAGPRRRGASTSAPPWGAHGRRGQLRAGWPRRARRAFCATWWRGDSAPRRGAHMADAGPSSSIHRDVVARWFWRGPRDFPPRRGECLSGARRAPVARARRSVRTRRSGPGPRGWPRRSGAARAGAR